MNLNFYTNYVNIADYLTIAFIALFASISPGPDFLVVAKNALTRNRSMAVITSIGVGAGMLVHTVYCVLGIAFIIANSILMFSIVKYLGASYLVYLGVKSLRSYDDKLSIPNAGNLVSSGSAWNAFRDGFVTNVFNPKVTLFMLSIFTVIVSPVTPRLIQASYGIEIALITGSWFVFLSFGLTHPFIFNKISNSQRIINIIIGFALIALGMMVAIKS
jgi:RhtB (resistance to homoserine/threonine) family protein